MNDTKRWERRETAYSSYAAGDPLCNNTPHFPSFFSWFHFPCLITLAIMYLFSMSWTPWRATGGYSRYPGERRG